MRCISQTREELQCSIEALEGQGHCHIHASNAERAAAGLRQLPAKEPVNRGRSEYAGTPIVSGVQWGASWLICPRCGANDAYYLHPVQVLVRMGDSTTVVDRDGTRIQADGLRGSARGVIIDTIYLSEQCEHQVVVRQAFHKGNTSITTITTNLSPEEAKEIESGGLTPIWRD